MHLSPCSEAAAAVGNSLQRAQELASSLYMEEVGHNADITSCKAAFCRSHLLRVRSVLRKLLKAHRLLWGQGDQLFQGPDKWFPPRLCSLPSCGKALSLSF